MLFDRSVRSVGRRFSFSPLLHLRVFEFRSHGMAVPSTKNIASSFEDTLLLGTCIPGISPCGKEGVAERRALRKGGRDNPASWRKEFVH